MEEEDDEDEAMNEDGDGGEGSDDEGDGVQLFNRSKDMSKGEEDAVDDADATPAAAAKRLKAFRRAAGIHVQGSDIPPPFSRFSDLLDPRFGSVPEYLISNLTKSLQEEGCQYEKPTPIQQQAIPILLKGRELLACAPTGSGKTASFVIPLLAALKRPGKEGFRALVLSPTRELAEQTHRCFTAISRGRKFKIFHLNKANANSNTFGKSSATNRDVLITTPMRLVHLIEKEEIDLSQSVKPKRKNTTPSFSACATSCEVRIETDHSRMSRFCFFVFFPYSIFLFFPFFSPLFLFSSFLLLAAWSS